MKYSYAELLRELRRSSMAVFRRFPVGRHEGKLTVSELFSLYLIEMLDGPTLKTYAETMGISQPNATYKINSLVEKGYVEKRLSKVDRRETNIYTTKKAKKIIKDAECNPDMVEKELRSRFSQEQLQLAGDVFRVVVELMDE